MKASNPLSEITPQSPMPAPPVVATTAPRDTAPAAASLPERRQLIIVLAVIEGVLLLLPLVFGAFLWAQPVPVDQGPGGPCVGAGDTTVLSPGYACGNGPAMPLLALLAVLCVLLALLVLPVLIGFVSRRWQTALAAPTAPVWVLAVLAAVLVALPRGTSLYGYGYGGTPVDSYNPILSLVFTTPLVLMVPLTAALGGLAWLLHRGFAR